MSDCIKPETRAAGQLSAAGRKLVGYAAIFNQETRIGPFIETISPGAFSKALESGGDVVAMIDHDTGKVLGRTRTGTLRLSQDAKGLAFELDLPDTQLARDVLVLAERGDISEMSFGFLTPKNGETWSGMKRTLKQIDLKEISIVSAWPAYSGTSVSARSKEHFDGAMTMQRRLRLIELGGAI